MNNLMKTALIGLTLVSVANVSNATTKGVNFAGTISADLTAASCTFDSTPASGAITFSREGVNTKMESGEVTVDMRLSGVTAVSATMDDGFKVNNVQEGSTTSNDVALRLTAKNGEFTERNVTSSGNTKNVSNTTGWYANTEVGVKFTTVTGRVLAPSAKVTRTGTIGCTI